MGRDIDDVQDLLARLPYQVMGESGQILRVKLGYQWMTPPQVSAEILRALKKQAHFFGKMVFGVVRLIVPVWFLVHALLPCSVAYNLRLMVSTS